EFRRVLFRSLDPHVRAAVHRFLLPDPELIGELVILVGQQSEWQRILLLELLVRRNAVGTYSDHLRVGLAEPRKSVPEIARLFRAARGVVLRIEIEDRVPAAE